MFSAADLIDALRKRARPSLRPQPPAGEFPPSWAQWFEAVGQRLGRITGATADAIIAILLQREPAARPRAAIELDRWQAFATLWRQQWQPPEREERRVRMAALVVTFFVHVVLVIILFWLAYVRFTGRPAPEGEEIVQVEFIGQGTPQDQGGGPPAKAVEKPPTPAAPARTRAAPAPTAASTAKPPSPQAAAVPAEAPPLPTSPSAQQPLQVTEKVATPEAPFVLPPPTPPRMEIPQAQIAVPKLQTPLRAVELVEVPPPVQRLEATLPAQPMPTPQLKQVPTAIPIIAPLPPVQAQALPALPVAQPTLREHVATIPLHEAPPSPSPSPSTAPAPLTAPSAQPATASTAPATTSAPSAAPPSTAPSPAGGATAAQRGTQPNKPAAGSGPLPSPRPGAWPTPQRGDDWGASTRNRPGGNTGKTPGLFNGEGTPRLPAGTAEAGGGLPPGSDRWTREDFDRAGTWLKRPPNDYEPTRFDRVWIPNETLLEQWVRQNIRSMDIPIPGTSKKLHCVVSLLQLGGGCGITDPNINDQEATARPPPEVPFKPDLQEDQGSLRKPGKP